ncbi:DUF3558 domain-containing protein [Streptomyces sp. NPDC058279]|uniref:DUF3558 domain-containing protein n=1 Tax=Streptomyces sp. NPDC058279 TaxID=3346418 RepID=UPI0036ED3C9C
MQRKAVRRRALPGVAILTALVAGVTGLTGCTETSGSGATTDAKAGGSTAVPVQPGKYRNLPAPCKAADAKRLRAMLPADESLTTEQRERLYAGTADASYDADRRVGCRWTAQTPSETRLLSIGFERVVSYDRATTSDDDKARQVYVRRLTDAHLPFPGASATPSPTASAAAPSTAPSAAPSAPPGQGGSPGASAGSTNAGTSTSAGAGPTPTAPPELGSRVLEGLGNEAYIEDKLSPAGTTAPQSRTVRTVFRTSNVIVTIEYSVQPAQPGVVPSSVETQGQVRQLAQALVERFNE